MVDPEDVAKALERYVFDDAERKLHGRLGQSAVAAYTWEKSVAVMLKRLKALQEEDD
jgi:hypothetical protein